MEVAIMVDKASAVAGPGKMKCKSCDGKGKWRIVARVIDKDSVHDAPPVWMDCHKCKGTGIKDIKEYEAEEKEWAEFWCSCGNPSGHSNRVDDYTPGAACAKHHYVCNDCGKVTQVG